MNHHYRVSPEEKLAKRLVRYKDAIALVDSGEASGTTQRAVELLRKGVVPIDMPPILGVSRARVYSVLADPMDVRARLRKRKRHGNCLDCGRPTYNGGSEPPVRCAEHAALASRKWSKERLVECAQEYARRYGRPPTAMDWNIPMARGRAHPERLREILQRDSEAEWPPTGTVLARWGSWNEMLSAAGFDTLVPGERRDVARWAEHLKKGSKMRTIEEALEHHREVTEARVHELEEKLDEAKQELAKVELLLETAASSNGTE